MDLFTVGIVGVGAFFVGGFVVKKVRDVSRRRRPTVSIASCRPGDQVKCIGRAIPLTQVSGPLTGRPCVAWHVVGEFSDVPAGAGQELKSRSRWSAQAFAIEDDSGRAVVDPTGADVVRVLDLEFDAKQDLRKETLEADVFARLSNCGLEGADEVKEAVIEPGERIAVFATVASVDNGVVLSTPTLISDRRAVVGK